MYMNFYEIVSWDYDGDYRAVLCHEKEFSEKEFSLMCAKCFAEAYSLRSNYFEDEIKSRIKDIEEGNYIYEEEELKIDLEEYSHLHFEYGDLLEYAYDFMCSKYGFKSVNPLSTFVIKSNQSPSERSDIIEEGIFSNHNLIKSIYESKRFILIEKINNYI